MDGPSHCPLLNDLDDLARARLDQNGFAGRSPLVAVTRTQVRRVERGYLHNVRQHSSLHDLEVRGRLYWCDWVGDHILPYDGLLCRFEYERLCV
jgi:hypothetical protein